MPEYRVDGVTLSGKTVSGSITADNKGIAKTKAAELSREKKFKVTVTSVRTQQIKGKEKVQLTRRGRFAGRKRNWKKALVTLKVGDKIDFFENV